MKRFLMIIVLIFTLLLSNVVSVSASFTDIDGSWAREAIIRLHEQGVFDGIYEGVYQPNSNVSRADLIEMAARGFDLTQSNKQTIYTWLDHLIPMGEDVEYAGDVLTRAELIALIANILGLTDQNLQAEAWYPSFDDLDPDHPVFLPVEMIHALGILPTFVMDRFEPNRLSSRAEVAAMLDAALALKSVEGSVTEIHASTNRLIVQTGHQERLSLPIVANTFLFQGGRTIALNQIKTGDTVYALYDKYGDVRIVTVNDTKQNLVTNNLIQSLTSLAQGLEGVITPEQVISMLSGDVSSVSEGFRYNVYRQLIDLGISPWEAEAFLSQDWDTLQSMGRDRLAFTVSDYAGITPEILYAAMNQNWDRVMEYAQVEVAQRLLSGMLF